MFLKFGKEDNTMKNRNIFSIATIILAITLGNIFFISGNGSIYNKLFAAEITKTLGTTIYVDDNASPGGDGSKGNPFNTIKDGLNAAAYGDTVLVFPGTYIENVIMKTGVVLLGSGAKSTIIRANTNENALAIIVGANDAVIRNFTIIHPGTSDQRHAIFCHNCSIKIFDNIIINYGSEHNSGNAIECYYGGATVARNLIHSFNNALSCVDSANVTFRNNIILHRNPSFKIGADVDLVYPSKIVVQNNTFVLIGIAYGFRIFDLDWSSKIIILNNIIYSPNINSIGISNAGRAPLEESYNNIFVGGDPYSGCNPGIGDIQLDPNFENIDRNDFRLAAGSPCIDAGHPGTSYMDVDSTRNDMGAFGGPDPISISLTSNLVKSVATSSISGFPGDTVKASVEVDNAAGIAFIKSTIEFDSSLLKSIDVQKSNLTKDFSLKTDIDSLGQIKIELSNDNEIKSGEGSLADIFFVVDKNAQPEQASPLRLQSITLLDGAGSPINIKEITHGVFITNYIKSSDHVIFVDARNNGLENGSQKFPFNTIAEGINKAEEGDTVFVSGGIYNEILEINKGIFLRGAGARVTTIEDDGQNQFDDYVVRMNTDKHCGISGVTIKNEQVVFKQSLLVVNAQKAVIIDNRMIADDIIPGFSVINWSNADGGLLSGNYIQGSLQSIEIKNSLDLLVHNNVFVPGGFGTAAITCDQSETMIIGNKINLIGAGWGIAAKSSSNVFIKNNIIESKVLTGAGIDIRESTAEVINNTIVVNDYGVWSAGNAITNIKNNIIIGFNRGSWGIRSEGTTTSSYNDLWGHAQNYHGISAGIGDISKDPIFQNSTQSNFRLNPASPCIDAGDPDPAYNDHNGSRNDMGVFGGPLADTSGFLGRQINVAFARSQNFERDTLLIPVTATDVQGINNFEMQIKFNESQLSVLAVRQGELTQAFTLTESKESPGIIRVNLSSLLDIGQNTGSIYELLAQVKNSSDTTIVIRLENLVFRDQIENEYTAASVEGYFNISTVNDEKTESSILPEKITLHQNYPNPFNPITTIRFDLPKTSMISLKIYNMLGQEIRTLYDGMMIIGAHHVVWNGKDDHGIKMSSGLYFYRLSVAEDQWSETKKMVLIR